MKSNVYLVTGDSYKLVNAEIQKIIGSFSNVINFDLRISNLKDIITEANYYSLTGEPKFIVVKGCSLFKVSKKDDIKEDSNIELKLLESYILNPNPLCTIIFVTYEAVDKRKKIFKIINEKGKVVLIPSLNKKELTYKCMDILKSKDYKIDYDVANYIVDNSYVNYDIMTNELDKIYALLSKGNLKKDDIKEVISNSVTNDTFAFANALLRRDFPASVDAKKNFDVLKIEPAMIISVLAKEFQILLMIKKRFSLHDIQNLFHKEDWQMNNYIQNANNYTENEIKKIIIKLNDYDYKLKCGLLDRSVILDVLAIDLCE